MTKGFAGIFCMALALAACAESTVKNQPVAGPAKPSPAMVPDALFERAAALLLQHHIPEGRAVLRQIVSGMPAEWSPISEGKKSVAIAYWDQQEFIECSSQDGQRYQRDIAWTSSSYTHAWYLIAFYALEDKDIGQAEAAIDRALALEPDRGLLLNEKATILQESRRFEDATTYNRRTIDSHRCVSAATRKADLSRAWRSLGVSLIELHKWDEADAALEQSLKVDPGNRSTMSELVYLEKMRGKKPQPAPVGIRRTNE